MEGSSVYRLGMFVSGLGERWHNEGRNLVMLLVFSSSLILSFDMTVPLVSALNRSIVGLSCSELQDSALSYSAREWCDLWEAGLWVPEVPDGVTVRSLSSDELAWVERAGQVGLLAIGWAEAVVFTVGVRCEGERLVSAGEYDWYVRSSLFWSGVPRALVDVMREIAIELLVLDDRGEMPSLVPEFARSGVPGEYRAVMRVLNREFYRVGWTLAEYRWFVLRTFGKMTFQVMPGELEQAIELMRAFPDADDE